MAGAALDPALDAVRDARRRWLVVVRNGPGGSAVWRSGSFCGSSSGRAGCRRGNCPIPQAKESYRAEAPVRAGAALLGEALASRSILVSFGAYHNSVLGGRFAQSVLPHAGRGTAVLRN